MNTQALKLIFEKVTKILPKNGARIPPLFFSACFKIPRKFKFVKITSIIATFIACVTDTRWRLPIFLTDSMNIFFFLNHPKRIEQYFFDGSHEFPRFMVKIGHLMV